MTYPRYTYFSNDPSLGYPKHNIYRCKPELFGGTDAELVISQEEIIALLRKDDTFTYNADVQHLIERMEDGDCGQLYENITFSDDHKLICFTFALRNGKFLNLLKGEGVDPLFWDDGAAHTAFL
jgi:hypothetical protein